ncbi:MAG: type II secretion system protein [Alphaproteobacteria bacterium]|nr:type II secretion system protein [Alphaproteobacteria bacterium]
MTNSKRHSGFSLIELCISLAVIGALLGPATYIYTQYLKRQAVEQTKNALDQAQSAVSNFRAIYGRYPCPAPVNAVQGDADYGYESRNPATGECVAVAGGVWDVASNRTAFLTPLGDDSIFIGSLPFRQMNLPDSLIHDGYGNRMTYAVTGLQANDATYENANGGITVVDMNDNQKTNPDDSAHYVIVAHSKEDQGAISRDGIMIGTCSATDPEGENCDFDNTFRVGQKTLGFDDLIAYNTADSIEQWQLSEANEQDIHLRRANKVALGIDESDDPTGFAEMDILDDATDSGIVKAEQDGGVNFVSGAFIVNSSLCDYNDANCFSPKVIAGQISQSEGLDCGSKFLVGVEYGSALCADELTFSCPNGKFMRGFNASGQIMCDTRPPIRCNDSTVTATCGDSRNISAFYDASYDKWYAYAYSGECYKIDALDTAYLDTLTTQSDMQDYVNDLNNAARTAVDCGDTSSNGLVRDTYECDSAGNWKSSPVRRIQRYGRGTDWTSQGPINWASPYKNYSNSGTAYNSATPRSSDPSNTQSNHDCWCREDYKLVSTACGGTATGQIINIYKHKCPQTDQHDWDLANPAYQVNMCQCAEGTTYDYPYCYAYFGVSSTRIAGQVTRTYDVTCPSGPAGASVSTLSNTDISNCTCPARPRIYNTANCPFGYTNSFTSLNGTYYVGKSAVYYKDWVCPNGVGNKVTNASQAGYYPSTWSTLETQTCTCNTAMTYREHVPCTGGMEGGGYYYDRPWNCGLNDYEPASASNLDPTSPGCHFCYWEGGTARSELSDYATDHKRGTQCSSCSDGPAPCYESYSSTQFKVYDGCTCVAH